ncbi:MAG: Ig-like domain-containing protein [Propionibacteriaceae bacterium]|nr:Ig-like domain-containing protein [Propionibacteriaceae bacterium]
MTVHATLGGLDVSGSPKDVSFTPGAIGFGPGATSYAVAPTGSSPVLADGVQSWTGTVTARDAKGNVLSGLTASDFGFVADSGVTVSAVSSDGAGHYSVTFTSTSVGSFQTSASYQAGDKITPGDLPVVFSAGEVCVIEDGCTPTDPDPAHHTGVVVSRDGADADGVATDEVTARAFDAQGHPVDGVEFTLATTDAGLTLAAGTVKTKADGVGTVTATSLVAGGHQVKASIGAKELVNSGSPMTLSFHATQASAATSTLTVDKSTTSVTDPITATVAGRDAQGNLLGAGVTFGFAVTGSAAVAASCTTTESGTCAVTITDHMAETVTAHATLSGVDIVDSPTDLSFTPGSISFGPGATQYSVAATDPTASSVLADGVQSWTGTVTAKDAKGNLLTQLSAGDFGFWAESGVKVSAVTSDHAGHYSVAYTSKLVGDRLTRVSYHGDAILPGDLPIVFSAGGVCVIEDGCTPVDPDPSHRTGVFVSVDGADADGVATDEVTVRAFDAQGHPLAGVEFTLSTTDATLALAGTTLKTGANGLATITATSTVAGGHQVTASVGATELVNTGSPLMLTYNSTAVSATASTLTVDKDTASVEDVITATVTARDAQGNQLGEGITFNFTTSGKAVQDRSCKTGPDGVCAVRITDDKAETVTLIVRLGDADINGSPKDLTFVAGEPGQCVKDPSGSGRPGSHLVVDPTVLTIDQTAGVSVFVTDRKCNPVGPGHDVTVKVDGQAGLTDKDKNGQALVVTTGEDSTARATLTDSLAETVSVSALIGADQVTDSPTSVTFTACAVDGHQSSLTVAPATQQAGSDVQVTINVRDRKGNPVTGLNQSDFQLTGTSADRPDLSFGRFAAIGDGTYTFLTTSVFAGRFEIGATVTGVKLDAKASVEFVAGDVCVSNCHPQNNPDTPVDESKNLTRIVMDVNDALADGHESDIAKAYAYDTHGNPITGAVFTAADLSGADLSRSLNPAKQDSEPTDAQGVATLSWTSIRSGVFSATAMVRSGSMPIGVEVPVSPTNGINAIRFTVGTVSPGQSQLLVSPKEAQEVASLFDATAVARDPQGNPVAGVVVNFTVDDPNFTDDGPISLDAPSCTTVDDGTCTVRMTSEVAGTFAIHATTMVGRVAAELGGGGDPAQASPQSVTFIAGMPCRSSARSCEPVDDIRTPDEDESKTHFSRVEVVRDNAQADDDDVDQMMIYAYDFYGNPVPGLSVGAFSPFDPALNLYPPKPRAARPGSDRSYALPVTDSQGKAEMDGSTKVAGEYDAVIVVNDQSLAGSNTKLHFLAGPLAKIELDIDPTTAQPAGSRFRITANARDDEDNRVQGASVTFNLPKGLTTVPASSPANCVTHETGQCWIDVTSVTAGDYTVSAQAASRVSNQVQARFVASGADAAHSTAEVVVNGSPFDGATPDVVEVTVRDIHGNPIQGAKVTSTAVDGQADGLAVIPVIAATDTQGKTIVSYTSTQPGAKRADILIDGRVVPQGSPVELQFGNGQGDPAHSDWDIAPTRALPVGNDDASTFTATATVRDVFNRPVEGSVVSFRIDKSTTSWGASSHSCTTDTAGECSVTVTSTKAGTYQASASIRRGGIGQAKSMMWEAAAVSAEKSRVWVREDFAKADGVAHNLVVVEAHDKYGNPVSGQVVTTTPATNGLRTQTGVKPTNAEGITTVWYASPVAGSHRASVAVGSGLVSPTGSPLDMTFVAGEPDLTKSWLDVDFSRVSVGQPVTATATVRDSAGNAVPNATVSLSLPADSSAGFADPVRGADHHVITCDTAAAGSCSRTFTDLTAESVDVRATVKVAGESKALLGSPWPVTFVAGCVPLVDPGCPDPGPDVDNDHRSRVQVKVDHQLAGGPVADVAEVLIFDQYGNPVDRKVTSRSDNPLLKIGKLTSVGSGATRIPYTTATTAAADHTARVLVDGRELRFLPQPGSALDNPAGIAANSSPVSLHFVGELVLAPPTITSPDDGTITNHRPLPIVGDGRPGATVVVVDQSDREVCYALVNPDGHWTCAADLADGAHSLTATQHDPSGVTSDRCEPVRVVIDTVGPKAPVVDEANGEHVTGHVPGDVSDHPQVEITWPDGSTSHGRVGDDGSFSVVTPPNMPSGPITIVAKDPAGNVSPETKVDLDTDRPGTPVIDVGNGDEITGRVPGPVDDGTKVVVTYPKDDGSTGTITVPVGPDGRWSVSTPDDAVDGPLDVVATDPAGNVSDPGHGRLDVTPPKTPVIDVGNGDEITGRVPGPNDDGTQVIVTYPKGDGSTGTITVPVGPDGRWSVPTPDDAVDGPLDVVATDPAGNVSEPGHGDLNVSGPTTPIVYPPNGSEIGGEADPGDRIVIRDGDSKPIPGCENVVAGPDGHFSCTPTTPLHPGDTITVVAKDPAGNSSQPVTVTVVALDMQVTHPRRYRLQTQEVTGLNFNPSESVCLTVSHSTVLDGGCQIAGVDGKVKFTFTVPQTFDVGTPTASLTGKKSGTVAKTFIVDEDVKITAPTGGTVSSEPQLTLTQRWARPMVDLAVWAVRATQA